MTTAAWTLCAVKVGCSAALLGVLLSACGDDPGQPQERAEPLPAATSLELPATVNGLDVRTEEIPAEALETTGTYASASSLYSFREEELLHGTLQVIELSADTPLESAEFRSGLISQTTTGVPTELRLSERDVFQSAGQGSTTSVWLDGSYLFVLSVRADYTKPRGLLQEILEISA